MHSNLHLHPELANILVSTLVNYITDTPREVQANKVVTKKVLSERMIAYRGTNKVKYYETASTHAKRRPVLSVGVLCIT